MVRYPQVTSFEKCIACAWYPQEITDSEEEWPADGDVTCMNSAFCSLVNTFHDSQILPMMPKPDTGIMGKKHESWKQFTKEQQADFICTLPGLGPECLWASFGELEEDQTHFAAELEEAKLSLRTVALRQAVLPCSRVRPTLDTSACCSGFPQIGC